MNSEQNIKSFAESEIFKHPHRYPITDKGLCIDVGEYDAFGSCIRLNHVYFKKGLILKTWEKWEFDRIEQKNPNMHIIK